MSNLMIFGITKNNNFWILNIVKSLRIKKMQEKIL